MTTSPRTFATRRTFPLGGVGALAPSGTVAAFDGTDGTVTLLDLRSGRRTPLAGRSPVGVVALSFSRDGAALAAGADDGSITVWDVKTASELESFRGHSSSTESVVFSPDGRRLYSVGLDGTVIVWALGGGNRVEQSFRVGTRRGVVVVAVDPTGRLVATTTGGGRVTVREAHSLRPIEVLRAPSDVWTLQFSPDGTLLAASGNYGIRIWNVHTRATVDSVGGGDGSVAFSPDGTLFASGGGDGSVGLYDVRTGKPRGLLGEEGSVEAVAFDPTGRRLVSGDLAGVLRIWDVRTQRVLFEMGPQAGRLVYSAAVSPDGKLVAAGDSDGIISFWSIADGRQVGALLTGLVNGVGSLAFDPSGKTLVAAGGDGKVELFDVATRKAIGAPLGDADGVDFFPDGRRVLGVSKAGTLTIWDVDPADWAVAACAIAHRNLTRAEWSNFLRDRSYRAVCP